MEMFCRQLHSKESLCHLEWLDFVIFCSSVKVYCLILDPRRVVKMGSLWRGICRMKSKWDVLTNVLKYILLFVLLTFALVHVLLCCKMFCSSLFMLFRVSKSNCNTVVEYYWVATECENQHVSDDHALFTVVRIW